MNIRIHSRTIHGWSSGLAALFALARLSACASTRRRRQHCRGKQPMTAIATSLTGPWLMQSA